MIAYILQFVKYILHIVRNIFKEGIKNASRSNDREAFEINKLGRVTFLHLQILSELTVGDGCPFRPQIY